MLTVNLRIHVGDGAYVYIYISLATQRGGRWGILRVKQQREISGYSSLPIMIIRVWIYIHELRSLTCRLTMAKSLYVGLVGGVLHVHDVQQNDHCNCGLQFTVLS